MSDIDLDMTTLLKF